MVENLKQMQVLRVRHELLSYFTKQFIVVRARKRRLFPLKPCYINSEEVPYFSEKIFW